jgi:hypothetical protein
MINKSRSHFRGLDSLRAFAAFIVLLGHIPMNQARGGIPNPHYGAIFYRGEPAHPADLAALLPDHGIRIDSVFRNDAGNRL